MKTRHSDEDMEEEYIEDSASSFIPSRDLIPYYHFALLIAPSGKPVNQAEEQKKKLSKQFDNILRATL